VRGLGGQIVELFGRTEPCSPPVFQLPFSQHVHQPDTGEGGQCCRRRPEPRHRSRDPLHTSVILLDDILEILHLADDDDRAMLLVVAADGLGQKTLGSTLVPLLREQKVNALAVFVHGTVQVVPLAFDPDGGLVHAPVDPHRPLAAMKLLLQLRAVFDDLTVDSGVIRVDTTFEHEFFDMARAQGIRHIPADTGENDILWNMGPLKLTAIFPLPLCSSRVTEGDHTPNGLKIKICDIYGPGRDVKESREEKHV